MYYHLQTLFQQDFNYVTLPLHISTVGAFDENKIPKEFRRFIFKKTITTVLP